MREKIYSTIKKCLAAACLFLCLTAVAKVSVWADTLTMTVESFTLGGGFVVEPVKVGFIPGETYADVLQRVLKAKNIEYKSKDTSFGFYLEGIKCADPGIESVPDIIFPILNDMHLELKPNEEDGLYEFCYTNNSGWMYYINNEFVDGMDMVCPKDGDAARFMFTLSYGADLTGEISSGMQDDKFSQGAKVYYETADKSDLVRLMGDMNQSRAYWEGMPGYPEAYALACEVMAQLDATAVDVQIAISELEEVRKASPAPPSPSPEIPAPSVTPVPSTSPEPSPAALGKVSGVKVQASGYDAIKVTWKKAKGASGYEIWKSGSKNGGYKRIKNVAGENKTDHTDKGLVTGKTYYYKIRAYDQEKDYGPWSAPQGKKTVLVSPSSLKVRASGKKAVLKWGKVKGASGYEIYTSRSKKGRYKKLKTITKGSAASYVHKNLKKGKTCYYKIRAYRNAGGKNKAYSGYSTVKYAKIK